MILQNIYEAIGKTPLVQLEKHLYAKIEFKNPTGSVKDRTALFMLKQAEKTGVLQPGGTIIEPTSGNTGVALCALAVQMGYQAIICMPDTMSKERIQMMKAFGARVVLTDGIKGMQGSIEEANRLHKSIPNSFIPSQFENPSNVCAHYETTGPEIYADLPIVDIFVAGIGTGGTITGVGRYLKEKNKCKIVGVEPSASPFLTKKEKGPHKIQGIGAGFQPEIYDVSVVDEVFAVSNEDAYEGARTIMKKYGIFAGISSGAAYHAALLLQEKHPDKNIVVLFPDGLDRYLSTDLLKE